jgi:hypothetical protein
MGFKQTGVLLSKTKGVPITMPLPGNPSTTSGPAKHPISAHSGTPTIPAAPLQTSVVSLNCPFAGL